MTTDRGHEFVDELARDADLVTRLLLAHVPDERGRCKGCAVDSSLRPPYPCGPQVHAALAQQRITPWLRPAH